MESCKKECCSNKSDKPENPCQKTTEYLQLNSNFTYTDASVKVPGIHCLFYAAFSPCLIDAVSTLAYKHGECPYTVPILSADIPIKISCFRI